MAAELDISVATAGQSITIFAVTYAVVASLIVTLTATMPRRRLLTIALTALAAASILSALVPTFDVLLTSRVFAAAGAAAYTPNARAVAASWLHLNAAVRAAVDVIERCGVGSDRAHCRAAAKGCTELMIGVISGIVHMLKSGARWRDCPPEYGPYTTVYNRFNRWSRQDIWLGMLETLTGHSGVRSPSIPPISGHTAGWVAQKGGLRASHRHLARRSHQQAPRTDPCAGPATPTHALARQYHMIMAGPLIEKTAGCFDRLIAGLRYQCHPSRHRRSGRAGRHPIHHKWTGQDAARSRRARNLVVPPQGLGTHRNTIRQTRQKSPRRSTHCRNDLILMLLSL